MARKPGFLKKPGFQFCNNRVVLQFNENGLSVNTLMKIFASKVRVEKQALKRDFRAFNRVFQQNHYCFSRLLTMLAICKTKLYY
jgi:hypothetical protein